MALMRPVLFTTSSFDATLPKTFLFDVQSGGAQIIANRLTIRKQSDNSIVYNELQNTFKYEHIVPANSLINGEYYNASVVVYDGLGNQSPSSLSIQFKCYSTPTIGFTNIPQDEIINNSSYSFEFKYEQSEGERLNAYIINLYNEELTLVSTSGSIYVQDGTSPYINEYLFAGFEDGNAYYIEITGETISGFRVSSPKNRILIRYTQPSLFTLIKLNNNCQNGYISVTSNIVLINGTSYPDPPIFIDNKEIDLTMEGGYVDWNQGFSINRNFLTRAWFRKPNPYTNIIKFSNVAGQTISVDYMLGYKDVEAQNLQSYVQVTVNSIEGMEYYIFSNYIDTLNDNEYYNLQLNRINGIYQVELLKMP